MYGNSEEEEEEEEKKNISDILYKVHSIRPANGKSLDMG